MNFKHTLSSLVSLAMLAFSSSGQANATQSQVFSPSESPEPFFLDTVVESEKGDCFLSARELSEQLIRQFGAAIDSVKGTQSDMSRPSNATGPESCRVTIGYFAQKEIPLTVLPDKDSTAPGRDAAMGWPWGLESLAACETAKVRQMERFRKSTGLRPHVALCSQAVSAGAATSAPSSAPGPVFLEIIALGQTDMTLHALPLKGPSEGSRFHEAKKLQAELTKRGGTQFELSAAATWLTFYGPRKLK